MSDNLLNGVNPKLLNGTTHNESMWVTPARTSTDNSPTYYLEWPLSQSALTANQTYRVAMSTLGDGSSENITAHLTYKDAAGNTNALDTAIHYGTSWARSEATFVVPSGMTPVSLSICKWGKHPAVSVANPVLTMGTAPVVLAISSSTLAWSAGIVATTRYHQLSSPTAATPTVPTSSSSLGSWTETEPAADVTKVLWTCERTVYADGTESWSKASKSTSYEAAKSVSAHVKQLSDRVTSTVSEQTKWNDSYSSRTSSLEQTAAGISASLDSMSSTDESIHQWMSFGQGTDGKPTLTIGTSDSDIVSRQTNSGLSYHTRGGTELLALDAASRSSTMPHVHADDVSMGSWQLGPTQGGTHFTLMYIGG